MAFEARDYLLLEGFEEGSGRTVEEVTTKAARGLDINVGFVDEEYFRSEWSSSKRGCAKESVGESGGDRTSPLRRLRIARRRRLLFS